MTWLPISLTVPQYEDTNGNPFSGAVLKPFLAGTSTNINFATDSTGATLISSIALNADGYPEVSGNIVIPHIDRTYKLIFYPTQAAADTDTGAIWGIDNLTVDPSRKFVTPKSFGALGSGADDNVALQKAVDDLNIAGGGTLEFDEIYSTSVPINCPYDNISFISNGQGGLRALGSANIQGLINITGVVAGTGPLITVNQAQFSNILTVNSITGLAVGDYCRIDVTVSVPATYIHALTFQIHVISGLDINIGVILPFLFQTTDTYTIRKQTIRKNIHIDGMVFDYGAATGAVVRGIWIRELAESSVTNCIFKGFPSGAIVAGTHQKCKFKNLISLNCGGTESDYEFFSGTNCEYNGIISDDSDSFGPLFSFVHHSNISQIISTRAAGRGCKVDACSLNAISDIVTVQPDNDGFSLQGNSCCNTITNITCNGSKTGIAGDSIGFKDNGENNEDNVISNISAHGNVDFDINIPSRNAVSNLSYDTIAEGAHGIKKNWLTDGGQEIWLDGTSVAIAASGVAYGPNNFAYTAKAASNSTVSRQNGLTNPSQYCARVQRDSGQTGAGGFYEHPFTLRKLIPLRVRKVTIAFNARHGADFSPTQKVLLVSLFCGTGAAAKRGASAYTTETFPISKQVVLTTTSTRFIVSSSVVVPASTTQMSLHFEMTSVGTAGANDWFEIDDVMTIDHNSGVILFDHRPMQELEEEASYYLWKSFPRDTAPAQNAGANTGEFQWNASIAGAVAQNSPVFQFPRRMVKIPTVTLYSPSAATAQAHDLNAGAACTATATANLQEGGFRINTTGNAATAVGNVLSVHARADARL